MLDVDTHDFDYVSYDGAALKARLYRPRGQGPFPAMVDSHGGAWIQGTLVNNDPINRRVAAGGVVVLAADYRLPPQGTYPASVADMNYAVRWLKKNAEQCATRPELVGLMGTSSGGHLAVLAAMKPFDPRYSAVPLDGGEAFDGRAACVVAMWPVICPFTRYRENLERQARGDAAYAGRAGSGLDQMKYWLSEDAMAEGSPMLALERGDRVELPDTLYIQALCDSLHPRHCMDRFCAGYGKAGGRIETVLVEGEPYDLVRTAPDSAEGRRAIQRAVAFIHECKARAASRAA